MQTELHGIEAHFLSADLGRMQDHSAVALLARRWEVARRDIDLSTLTPANTFYRYFVKFLRRYPLGTEYEQVMNDIEALWQLKELVATRNHLLVDKGQVGGAIVEALRKRRLPAVGISITSGLAVHPESADPMNWMVPKAEIVTYLGRMVQNGRLQIVGDVEAVKEFEEELGGFGYKLRKDTGRVQYEALEEQVHDDLVMAVALAVWYAEHVTPPALPGLRHKAHVAPEYEPLARRG